MFDYYVLEDEEHKGYLIRQDPISLEEMFYDSDRCNWSECDIILKYMDLKNENFGKYHLINEKEAVVYINRLMFMKYFGNGFQNGVEV
ncbi:MAG: hypothetical protein LBD38_01110 [Streptococcaceae bacterium]|jgi:hypothetical protein|nr:hypothetical protein [Streptococcaceae bacterium]